MVNIKNIDFSDQRFRLSFSPREEAVNKVKQALKEAPIMDRIILYAPPSKERKIIVDGFKRATFYKQEGKEKIPAKVVSHKNKTEREMFLLSLAQNSFTHEFHLMDKVRIISALRFTYELSKEKIKTRYSEFIGIPRSKKYISKLEKIGHLSPTTKVFMDKNNYKMESALAFTKYTSDEQNMLLDFLEGLHLTESVLRKILVNIYEIMAREDKSLEELLNQISEELDQEDTDELRKLIFNLRYPEYSAYRSKLNKLKEDLSLPQQIKLITPKHFEGNKFTLQVNFNSVEQIRNLREKLDKVIGSETLEEILELY